VLLKAPVNGPCKPSIAWLRVLCATDHANQKAGRACAAHSSLTVETYVCPSPAHSMPCSDACAEAMPPPWMRPTFDDIPSKCGSPGLPLAQLRCLVCSGCCLTLHSHTHIILGWSTQHFRHVAACKAYPYTQICAAVPCRACKLQPQLYHTQGMCCSPL